MRSIARQEPRADFGRNCPVGELGFAVRHIRDYQAERKTLDERFARFADEVQAEDLAQRLRYKNYKGDDQDR